jgi:hypothetical protein
MLSFYYLKKGANDTPARRPMADAGLLQVATPVVFRILYR